MSTPIQQRVKRSVVVLLALVLGLGGVVLFMQRLFLFPRHLVQTVPGAAEATPGLEQLWLDTRQGKVEAWFLPGEGASAQTPGPAVIFAHGNGEVIDHWPGQLARYRAMGYSVLLPEYRGYGRSAGSPTAVAITDDFVRFYDLLVARPEVDGARVVFHGRSLGGGAVCALAARRKPQAVILQSTFTSVRNIMRGYMIPGFMVMDPFDNEAVIASLDVPLLVIHGKRDALIPHHHARRLVEVAPQGRLVSYDCDHNDCPPAWGPFWSELQGFLEALTP